MEEKAVICFGNKILNNEVKKDITEEEIQILKNKIIDSIPLTKEWLYPKTIYGKEIKSYSDYHIYRNNLKDNKINKKQAKVIKDWFKTTPENYTYIAINYDGKVYAYQNIVVLIEIENKWVGFKPILICDYNKKIEKYKSYIFHTKHLKEYKYE